MTQTVKTHETSLRLMRGQVSARERRVKEDREMLDVVLSRRPLEMQTIARLSGQIVRNENAIVNGQESIRYIEAQITAAKASQRLQTIEVKGGRPYIASRDVMWIDLLYQNYRWMHSISPSRPAWQAAFWVV